MINWIVTDYYSRCFQRRKNALFKAHFNERKCLLEAMKLEDPEERLRALQEAARNLGLNRQYRKKKKSVGQDGNAANNEKS